MEKIPEQSTFNGKRVVLFGPECTGKSTMARKLAGYYKTSWVPEYAREYSLNKLKSEKGLVYKDVLPITVGQRQEENNISEGANRFLFCDTDILQTWVYSRHYYNRAPQELSIALETSRYDLYLLTSVDVPWEEDGVRDRPSNRLEMFNLFKSELESRGKSYVILSGSESTRFATALKVIERL